jgi:zinc protease
MALEVRQFDEALAPSGTGVDRSKLPEPTTFSEAPFPSLSRATLSNGLRLIVAERHAVPTVQFSLQVNAGFAADQLASPGVTSLAMEMLDEGTSTKTALEIDESLADLGADLDTGANLDFCVVTLNALTANLDKSLAIYADVILNPAFDVTELERLRRLQIASIQQEKADPTSLGLRVLPPLLYGAGNAYAIPMTGTGTEASVAAIGRNDLVQFHAHWFKPNNATLIVVGDTTLAQIQPKLESLFARWQRGDVPTKQLADGAPPSGPRVYLIDRPGSEQSVIIAGELIPKKSPADDIALDAMNDILGGAFTSRINMNLREDKTWSYGADTTIVDTAAQRPFLAIAPVQADRTAEAMHEIQQEIEQFVGSRAATEAEVATSKRRSTLTLPGRWETARSVARDIAELVRFGLPDDYWSRYAELVGALDVDGVNAVARRVLDPGKLTWVVVGDRNVVEQKIRDLHLGDVRIVGADGEANAR